MADNLRLYLDRLGFKQAPQLTSDGLAQLQAAHRQNIAFGNVDLKLGETIRIGSEEAFDKLVARGRPGYCFEQNRLYSDMLAQLGFKNRSLLARVRLGIGPDEIPPRVHQLQLVKLGGEDWIADAGFGGSFVTPMRLADGEEVQTDDGARHRLRHIGRPDGEWLLERAGPANSTDGRAADNADWQAQYSFDLAPVMQSDLEQANHFAATWPEGRFVQFLVLSIVLPGGFASLVGREFSQAQNGKMQKREIASAQEWRDVAADVFRLQLSAAEVVSLNLFKQ